MSLSHRTTLYLELVGGHGAVVRCLAVALDSRGFGDGEGDGLGDVLKLAYLFAKFKKT